MKRLSPFVWSLVLTAVAPVRTYVHAVGCPTIVKNVLDLTGRNQACYDSANLSAESQVDTSSFSFTKAGDFVRVDGLTSLTLSLRHSGIVEYIDG